MKRVFTWSKVLLCVYPFIALFYMRNIASMAGTGMQESLQANPILAVTFLSAMLQPFAAWLLTIVERRVNTLDYADALTCLGIICAAECLLKNWLGIIGCAILFYLVAKEMPYSFKKEFSTADRGEIFKDAMGPVVLTLLSVFVFFVSSRIG